VVGPNPKASCLASSARLSCAFTGLQCFAGALQFQRSVADALLQFGMGSHAGAARLGERCCISRVSSGFSLRACWRLSHPGGDNGFINARWRAWPWLTGAMIKGRAEQTGSPNRVIPFSPSKGWVGSF